MKKILFVAFLALSFYVPTLVVAQTTSSQTPGQCIIIAPDNHYTCCKTPTGSVLNKSRCEAYDSRGTIPGTVPGGTQNTNPQNSGSTNSNVITPTPQNSARELASCSAISFTSLLDMLVWLKCIIGAAVIPLIFTLAFLFFLWGMVQYIRNADNEKKREESKKFIYYGILGLVVMVSVWGIVQIVNSTLGFGNTVPQLQTDCLTTDPKNPCK